jgi:hypothetical protein
MVETLREIEKSHEAKYKMDEELRFKAQCRRDKLLGLWAAEQMEMSGEETQAYAKCLVRLNLDQPNEDAVKRKVVADFEMHEVDLTEHDVATALHRFLAMAIEQLARDFPTALDKDHSRVGG